MQTVTAGFKAIFARGYQTPQFRVELLESSGYNWPAGVTATYTSSGEKTSDFDTFAAANVGDGMSAEPAKYLVLDRGATIDNAFRFSGPDMRYNLGWWSDILSGAGKLFVTPPWHNTLYSVAIRCNKLRVTTSKAYSGLKTANVTVWYDGENLAGAGHDLGDQDFGTGDRVSIILSAWPDAKLVKQILVTPKETKTASDYARILEIEPMLEWSYDTSGSIEEYVSSLTIEKSSGTIKAYKKAPPGVGINVCKFKLDKGANITPTRNQLVRVYMGWNDELVSQGIFIISDAVPVPDGYDVTAHGHLSLVKDYPYPDTIYKDRTCQAMLTELLTWTGLGSGDLVFEWKTGGNATWGWYVVEGKDTEKTLSDMAEHFNVSVFEDELGKIHVRNDYSAASVLTIDDDMIASYGRAKPEEINTVVVSYGALAQGSRDVVLSGSVELEASETKEFSFRLSRSPCISLEPVYVESFKDDSETPVDLAPPTLNWYSADAYTVVVSLTNTVATAGTVTLKMYGVPIVVSDKELLYTCEDADSRKRRGKKQHPITLFTNSAAQAKLTGDDCLKYLTAARDTLRLTLNRLAPHLQLRDKVTVDSDELGVNADYLVSSCSLTQGANETEVELMPIGGF